MPFLHDFHKAKKSLDKFLYFINDMTTQGDRIISIEDSENDVLQLFDKYSGVDAVQITKDKQIRGMAMRVQYGRAWDTFTIRFKRSSGAKTEYEKRVDAIKNEKFYPHLTVQCYLSNDTNDILSVGIIKTKDLYNQLIMTQTRPAFEDGNIFLYIEFGQLKNVMVYTDKKGVRFFRNKKQGDV